MTLASWMIEFLPVPASVPRTAMEAIDHSILKWSGRLPENLAKHDVFAPLSFISEHEDFTKTANNAAVFGSEDCALCNLFYAESDGEDEPPDAECKACPLAQSLDRPCVSGTHKDGETRLGVYHRGLKDAAVMIEALKACREDVIEKIIDEQHFARLAEEFVAQQASP